MKLLRTIGIILIVLASVLPIFLSGIFIAGRLIIREIMLEKLEEENVQTIYIAVDDFRWYKQDREIVVENRMFDVKKIEQKDGLYVVTGIFDEMESELNLQLEKSSEDRNSKANGIYLVCLGLVADGTGDILPDLSPHFILLHKSNLPNKARLYWTNLELLFPPPKV